jgi:hypothetical protein
MAFELFACLLSAFGLSVFYWNIPGGRREPVIGGMCTHTSLSKQGEVPSIATLLEIYEIQFRALGLDTANERDVPEDGYFPWIL